MLVCLLVCLSVGLSYIIVKIWPFEYQIVTKINQNLPTYLPKNCENSKTENVKKLKN